MVWRRFINIFFVYAFRRALRLHIKRSRVRPSRHPMGREAKPQCGERQQHYCNYFVAK